MIKFYLICSGPCCNKVLYGLRPALLLVSFNNATSALFMNLVCKELNSSIYFCGWDPMIQLFCCPRSLNGLDDYIQYYALMKTSSPIWNDLSASYTLMRSDNHKMIMSFLLNLKSTTFSNE